MACFRPTYWLTLLTILVLLTCSQVLSDEQDAARLLKFRASLSNIGELSNWNDTIPPCNGGKENWKGLNCKDGSVSGLQLENMSLGGTIDMDTLAEITTIRSLSFMNNSFEGSMPNLSRIGPLRRVSLSYNKFSGEIGGEAFSGMNMLNTVELANNGFTGTIPISLTQLPLLTDLQLQNNQFEGKIPDFEQKDLKVNFANNKLDGTIPQGMRNQDPNSFAVNPKLVCKHDASNSIFSSFFRLLSNFSYV